MINKQFNPQDPNEPKTNILRMDPTYPPRSTQQSYLPVSPITQRTVATSPQLPVIPRTNKKGKETSLFTWKKRMVTPYCTIEH